MPDLTEYSDDALVQLFSDLGQELVSRALQDRAAEMFVSDDENSAEEIYLALDEALPEEEDA